MANSADLDQKPTDMDLHCLQKQDISRISRTRGNWVVKGCMINGSLQVRWSCCKQARILISMTIVLCSHTFWPYIDVILGHFDIQRPVASSRLESPKKLGLVYIFASYFFSGIVQIKHFFQTKNTCICLIFPQKHTLLVFNRSISARCF